jgi:hypothetical protein
MMILSLLKSISLRQYAIAGVALAFGLFLLAFYLRGLEVRECRATIAAVEAYTEAKAKQMAEAAKRHKDTQKRQKKALDRALREINQNAPNPASDAIVNAASLLCNQGAAGCGAK